MNKARLAQLGAGGFKCKMPRWKLQAARRMRKRPTPAERLLWSRLRKKQLGFIFHRQARMLGYIADFYCPRTLIVVEVDGSFHDGRQAYDAQRDRVLTDFGFRVMRFRNDEVIHDTERVIDVIRLACQAQC